MGDTIRGTFPGKRCSDCGVEFGKEDIGFQHWGPLVPSGAVGRFCPLCMSVRSDRNKYNYPALPLGQTDYVERGVGKVVILSLPDNQPESAAAVHQIASWIATWFVVPTYAEKIPHRICEFGWDPRLNSDEVNGALNKFRQRFPQLAISMRDGKTFPPRIT